LSAAGAFGLRQKPEVQQSWATLEKKHAQGNALPMVAHQLARAVSERLQRAIVLAMHPFLHRERAACA
jgi:hypothetical protein